MRIPQPPTSRSTRSRPDDELSAISPKATGDIARRPSIPSPVALPSGGRVLTPSFVTLVVYIWLIYSYKLPGVGLWVAAALITALLQRGRRRFPAPLLWLGAFLLWAWLSSLGSAYPEETSYAIGEFLKVWLIFFVTFNAVRTPSQVSAFILCNLGIFAAYPIRGIFANIAGGFAHQGRYAWNFIFSNPNDFATFTLLMIGLNMVALQSATAVWQRCAALLGAILLPVAILFTASRAGFLGLVLFAALLLSRSRSRVRSILLGAIAAAAVAIAAPPEAWERIRSLAKVKNTDLLETEADESARQRYAIWQIAYRGWQDHPVFGVGLGAAPSSNAAYAHMRPEWALARGKWNTHNTFLNVLVETGIVGFMLFCAMFVSVFRHLARARRAVESRFPAWAMDLRYLEVGLVAFILAASFGVVHNLPYLYSYLAICWLLAGVFRDVRHRGDVPGARSVS